MWWNRCPPVKNELIDIDSMYLAVTLERPGFSSSGGELRMAGSMWSSDGSVGDREGFPWRDDVYAMSFLSDQSLTDLVDWMISAIAMSKSEEVVK